MSEPDQEIRALKAALREARWQNYHLFIVQRQRAFHARQREKDLIKELRQQGKALQKAKRITGYISEAVAKLKTSWAGFFGGKRLNEMEQQLTRCDEWVPLAPESIDDLGVVERFEDQEESLRVPFLAPTADVVICVHNALEDVKVCLESVVTRSPKLQNIILVNDGSDEPTSAYLREFAENTIYPTEIIHNVAGRGYTIAANQGMRRSQADYVFLLNSDTIVTHHWMENIIACGESNPDIGIIGTLSNAASWQSVPERFGAEGDWEVNELPEGVTPDDVACRLLLQHEPSFPRVPLVNGFCFVIRRAVFNKIGYLDEETFPRGYGEENDFCLRASAAGFNLAIADNTYVFHAKSKSFTHERRKVLSKNATRLLHEKHSQQLLDDACALLRDDPGLEKAREVFSEIQTERVSFRVLFLMDFKGEGGGTHSIVQETNGLCQLGVFAQMAIRDEHADFYAEKYPGFPSNRFYAYQSDYELAAYAGTFDVVVATLFTSVDLLKRVKDLYPGIVPGYYIQDYEALFYEEANPLQRRAKNSYSLIPDAVCFSKTQWLCDTLDREEGVAMNKITPSIDHGVYYPAEEELDSPPIVAAMIRPSTPRRSPELTIDVLRELKRDFGDSVEVVVFGCGDDDPFWNEIRDTFQFENRGVLTRQGVASVLRISSVFLDLSTYQAFGRTGLEAMACGCTPVLPAEGGVSEYAEDGKNAFVVDTTDREAILSSARRLLQAGDLRQQMRAAGIETAKRFTVEAAAKSEKALFEKVLRSR
ncbi:MAG: GT2 family glycosyltransferase [Verrucomicrobiales bacterium]